MPSDKHNSTVARAMFLLFEVERCPLAYHSMYNVFFMDLLVLSFVFHSSLLTAKSVNLVVAHDGFLCIMEIVCIFHSGYFNYKGAYELFLIHTAV